MNNSEKIDISNKNFYEVPSYVFERTFLKKLNLSGNKLRSLPESFGGLTTLTFLDLSLNELVSIPESFGCLTSLQKLDLSGNKLKSPSSKSSLRSLPESFGNLIALQKLHLSHNKLTNTSFRGLTSLRYLYFSHNKLESIPEGLTALQKLDLSHNKLKSISFEGLTTLTYLNLSDNQLTSFPEDLTNLQELQELQISNNKLRSLLESFGNLVSLKILNISGNKLLSLPESFEGLTTLTYLNLHNNKLKSTSSKSFLRSIGNFTTLTYLDFSDNELKSLPVSLVRLHNLETLGVSNNPIEYTSPALLRFIEGLERRRRVGSGTVYNDAQSVHNSSIQKSVYDSLDRVLSERPLENKVINDFIIENKVLTEECKRSLIEYSEDLTIHSLLKITFRETLDVVLSIIIRHKDSDEILEIMNQEMSDAMCMCFTGRITRLLNVLNGYDPRVVITISDSEQIAAIIEIARKKTSEAYAQKELVTRDLLDRSYSKEIIEKWISFIE